jgi:hypothetical protein
MAYFGGKGGGVMGKVKQFLNYKESVRLISNVGRVTSCRELFRTLNILLVLLTMSLNVMGEWIALQLYIWKVLASNLDPKTAYPD